MDDTVTVQFTSYMEQWLNDTLYWSHILLLFILRGKIKPYSILLECLFYGILDLSGISYLLDRKVLNSSFFLHINTCLSGGVEFMDHVQLFFGIFLI